MILAQNWAKYVHLVSERRGVSVTNFQAFFEGSKHLSVWALALRTLILYIALIIATRFMGHRQVGILTGHNYLVAAGIVSLAAIRMINPESSLTSGLVVIVVYAAMNVLLSILDTKFPRLVDRRPVILMEGGKLLPNRLLDAHVTIDNLVGQLRLKSAHSLAEVDTVVLEPTGKVSVIKKPSAMPANRHQMHLKTKPVGLSTILIYDGSIQYGNLDSLGLTPQWLQDRLLSMGFSNYKDVFLAQLDSNKALFVTAKGE